MDLVTWNSAFKHAQNAEIQIVLRIRKVASAL